MREPNCQQHLQKGRKVAEPSQRALGNGRRIEDLAEKIESCRKFILASRIAVAGGVLALLGGHRRMGVEPQHGKASGE